MVLEGRLRNIDSRQRNWSELVFITDQQNTMILIKE